jgi:hypothetical protein
MSMTIPKQRKKETLCEPLKSALKALNVYGKHDISTKIVLKLKPATVRVFYNCTSWGKQFLSIG